MPDQLKNAIRTTIKQVRSKMPPTYRCAASIQICNRILAMELYKNAKSIALYHAANGEVDLSTLWKSTLLENKLCYFPALKEDRSLLFLPATPETPFKLNKFGISEPDVSKDLALDPDQIDLICMPLVAFDARCTRIGMGAGYYDKALKGKKQCSLIGVAYQFQRVDFIEPEAWDIPMNAVITNRAIYWREARL